VARLSKPAEIGFVVRLDEGRLAKLFDAWEAQVVAAPFNGGIRVDSERISADPPRDGFRVDRAASAARITSGFASWPRTPVDLSVVNASPFVAPGAVDAAVKRAMALVSDALLLRGPEGVELRFEKAEALAALRSRPPTPERPSVELYFDVGKVEEKLGPLRAKLESPPEDARFVVEKGDLLRIEPGRSGAILTAEKVALSLLAAAQAPDRAAPLPLQQGAAPAVPAEALAALRITKLVGKYTTHHPCCQQRVDNIHRIADMLRGQVVRPGESFSVNALVGPRTAKIGFKPAPTIEEGEMVDSLGGGVSQFATTLFNALFLAGYGELERSPHTFWFPRYPMGRDATLSWPKPDVAFKNDSDAGALIWTEYGDDFITVKVFGDTGGRKVRFRVSPQQNIVKPPLEYIPDVHQTHEKDKVMEAGQMGWTVVVERDVVLADGQKREDKRRVVYKPRTRRVVVHPCKVPAGEPGHTGEKCPEPEDAGAPGE
jgi:vancomycin resistance protein YoaR